MARAFVTLIAHCTQSCPALEFEGFHFHHFYYGLGLLAISIGIMGVGQDVRTRWDASLVLGIGTGLVFDEMGLILLAAGYWDPVSTLPIFLGGSALGLAAVYQFRRQGVSDFRILDRSDLLTVLSVLLALTGFLYFVRPVRMIVSTGAALSWAASLLLMSVYGRRHVLKILRGQVETP